MSSPVWDITLCHGWSYQGILRGVTSRQVISYIYFSSQIFVTNILPRLDYRLQECDVNLCHVTSRQGMSLCATSHHVTPGNVTLCHVFVSHQVMSHRDMSLCVASHHVKTWNLVSHYVTSCHHMSLCVKSCHITSRHVRTWHLRVMYNLLSSSVMRCWVISDLDFEEAMSDTGQS